VILYILEMIAQFLVQVARNQVDDQPRILNSESLTVKGGVCTAISLGQRIELHCPTQLRLEKLTGVVGNDRNPQMGVIPRVSFWDES